MYKPAQLPYHCRGTRSTKVLLLWFSAVFSVAHTAKHNFLNWALKANYNKGALTVQLTTKLEPQSDELIMGFRWSGNPGYIGDWNELRPFSAPYNIWPWEYSTAKQYARWNPVAEKFASFSTITGKCTSRSRYAPAYFFISRLLPSSTH